MSEHKHTPGPWIVSHGHEDFICRPLPREKGDVRDYELPDFDQQVCMLWRCPEMQANARLIANAPELLDMLEEHSAKCCLFCGDSDNKYPAKCPPNALCFKTRRLIDKAKGGGE